MSDTRAPQSPHEAREEIARLRLKLEALTDLYEDAVVEFADAHAAWEAAEDEAWLEVRRSWDPPGGKGFTKDYQAEVNKRIKAQRGRYLTAEDFLKGLEKRMRHLDTQIGAAQSEAKSLQAELDHAHYGESPQAPQWSGKPRSVPPSAPHPAEVA